MRIKTTLINQLIKPLRIKLKPETPLILIKEEFGYKQWFFIPNIPAKDLIKWWKRQKEQGLKYLPLHKVGTFIEASSTKEYTWNYETLSQNNYMTIIEFPDFLFNLWHSLKQKSIPGIWYAHLFYDDDTLLRTSSNLIIKHYGYHTARLAINKDIEIQFQEQKNEI